MNRSKLVIGLFGSSLVLAPSAAVVASLGASSASAATSTTTTMSPCYRDIENGGIAMTQSGGVSTYGALANRQWARSENIWGVSSRCVNLTRGRTLYYSIDVKTQPGLTKPSVWQTMSQLQGPTTNGTWPGPPVALVVESGQWRLDGGNHVPNGSGGYRSDLGYDKRLSTVTPNVWNYWGFSVVLGGPGIGSVTAWHNGRLVVSTFKPAAGTMYSVGGGYSTAWLQVKTGLYTGADSSADAPTWQRRVQIKNVRYILR